MYNLNDARNYFILDVHVHVHCMDGNYFVQMNICPSAPEYNTLVLVHLHVHVQIIVGPINNSTCTVQVYHVL